MHCRTRMLGSLLILAGCGGHSVRRDAHTRLEVAGPVRKPHMWLELPADAWVQPRFQWNHEVPHSTEREWLDAHGATCVSVGRDHGVRGENGIVRWSSSRAASETEHVFVTKEGVVFLGKSGSVESFAGCAEAPVFATQLGELIPLGREFVSHGELFARELETPSSLVRFPFGAPPRAIHSPEPLEIVSVGAKGLKELDLLLEGSVRMHSEDAGEHWTRMPPVAFGAVDMISQDEHVWLVDDVAESMYPVLAHGALGSPAPWIEPIPHDTADTTEVFHRTESTATLYPEVFQMLRRDVDGLHWERRSASGTNALVGVDSVTGHVQTVLESPGLENCSVATWHRGALVTCGNMFVVGDRNGVVKRGRLSRFGESGLVSSDGMHFFWHGSCVLEETPFEMLSDSCCPSSEAPADSLCHLDAESDALDELQGVLQSPTHAAGNSFGVYDPDHDQWTVYDLQSVSKELIVLPVSSTTHGTQTGVTSDGMYWSVLSNAERGTSTVQTSKPDATLVTYSVGGGRHEHVLQRPVESARGASYDQGVVVGVGSARHAMMIWPDVSDALWVSTDGFASWRKLVFAGRDWEREHLLDCNTDGCWLDASRLWVSFAATQPDINASWNAFDRRAPVELGNRSDRGRSTEVPRFEMDCHATATRQSSNRVGAVQAAATNHGWMQRLGPTMNNTFQIAWGGVDSEGAFGPLRGRVSFDLESPPKVLEVTRDGILVLTCNANDCALSLEGLRSQTLVSMSYSESAKWRDENERSVWVNDALVVELDAQHVRWIRPHAGTAGIRSFAVPLSHAPSVAYAEKSLYEDAFWTVFALGFRVAGDRHDILMGTGLTATAPGVRVPFDPTREVETAAQMDVRGLKICTQPPLQSAPQTYLHTRSGPSGKVSVVMVEERPVGPCIRAVSPLSTRLGRGESRLYRYTAQNGRLVGTLYGANGVVMGTETCTLSSVQP